MEDRFGAELVAVAAHGVRRVQGQADGVPGAVPAGVLVHKLLKHVAELIHGLRRLQVEGVEPVGAQPEQVVAVADVGARDGVELAVDRQRVEVAPLERVVGRAQVIAGALVVDLRQVGEQVVVDHLPERQIIGAQNIDHVGQAVGRDIQGQLVVVLARLGLPRDLDVDVQLVADPVEDDVVLRGLPLDQVGVRDHHLRDADGDGLLILAERRQGVLVQLGSGGVSSRRVSGRGRGLRAGGERHSGKQKQGNQLFAQFHILSSLLVLRNLPSQCTGHRRRRAPGTAWDAQADRPPSPRA